MGREKSLFDDFSSMHERAESSDNGPSNILREVLPLDRLRNLEEKIAMAVERVKALKEEKTVLEKKIKDMETILNAKNQEIEALRSEKSSIGNQIQELLTELETLEV